MDHLIIQNQGPLRGEVSVSGAKNAALPALCATLLSEETTTLHNMPDVVDVRTLCRILANFGMEVSRYGNKIWLDGHGLNETTAPYSLVKSMRASILVLGPLLARLGHAKVSLPGGCAIGARPVDLHLSALEQMGAEISVSNGYIEAKATRLQGAIIRFPMVTVTGTENIMMAATLAEGTTILHNAAQEPEVVDLGQLLIAMGADIEGLGTDTIIIRGKSRLHGATHTIIPDRIETGTWLCAAAITGSQITVRQTQAKDLIAFLAVMSQMGVRFSTRKDAIEVFAHRGLNPTDFTTQPHPGLPTDLQAQLMATLTQARGGSLITETIFENRFMHVAELQKMGASIQVQGNRALVLGDTPLIGTIVHATDLRASACLVLAALAAVGETEIHEIYHLDRGYDSLDQKLMSLGVSVRRAKTEVEPILVESGPILEAGQFQVA